MKKTYIGRRFIAGLVDYTIIFIVNYYLIIILGTPNDEDGYSVTGFLTLIPMSFWFLMTVGLEQICGSTLGNGIVSLKPIQENGSTYKLSFSQSFKRHIVDPIDMFFFGLVGYLIMKNTQKNQRLGDLWAKTIVVSINYQAKEN